MFVGIISVLLLLYFATNAVVVTIAVGIFGLVTASIGTLAPTVTSALFGNKDYSQIYSTASTGLAVASIIALPAYGYIFDFAKSYVPVLYILIAILIISILCIIVAFRDKEKLVEKGMWK
ncbi:hypothetical protein ACFFIS_06665 [Virgibacillus soli]|uniref:Major facilitator superfamily (MFS) profile domain-containing protein n=1 Tax=Paracerasibacillus soli TaxID=480284 RepID=A0ABU5CSL8_9BACI|nr:hypothetical protein [Virgibacillus soli]MDY0409363.1 hypothetical protein [Virgibacillus soli]